MEGHCELLHALVWAAADRRRGLDFTPPSYETMPADTPTIVVCHGLTGGSHESYVRNILSWVVKHKEEGGMGGRAVVVNVSATDIPVGSQLSNSSADVSITSLLETS